MQQVSEAYKTEQKQHLREKSYVWVYLGIVDRTAQRTAKIDKVTTPVTDWSKVPTGNDLVEGVYATYEQNFFRADGKMQFPPEKWAMYQGAASAGIGGSIKFEFETACDISGVSLKFYDDAVPTKFTISNGTVSNTYTYSELDLDDSGRCKCVGNYTRSTYITISPYDASSLKGGNQRLRIQQILFGLGFYFSNNDLLSTSFTNTVSHLSDQLPSKKFSFTIDNTSKKFSADDPHSFVHFLQEQQEVDFDYGRELPDGSIETIKGGKLYLKTWATDNQKATFNAVGHLEFMDTTYDKGHFNSSGTFVSNTLYSLAQEVFADAGITEYSIDASLANFQVDAPLPTEKHKNLLQLIANAGRCIFYEDRDGVLTIAPSYKGTVENATDYTLEYKDLYSLPNVSTTEFVKNVLCKYYNHSFSQERTQLGSYKVTDENEHTITFSEPVIIDDIVYEDNPIAIYSNYMGITLSDGDAMEFQIHHGDFYFTYGGSISSGHIDGLENGNTYTIRLYDGMLNVIKEVSSANTIRYVNNTGASQFIYSIHIEFPWYTSATIVSNSAYNVTIRASLEGKDERNLLIMGRKINVDELSVSENDIRDIGEDRTCRNVLISNETWAEENLDWMVDYYDDDAEYSLDYRGEPALDCDDVFYLENDFVSKNYVRVIESTINTSQGMSKCTMKARRSSWKDFAKVDFAKVDDSEVK